MLKEIYEAKCTGCGKCFSLCPLDVVRLDTQKPEISSCQAACPAGVNIRGYMYLLKLGLIETAAELIQERLPMPGITGRVCFHPCENNCSRKEVDDAVNINEVERFVADSFLKNKTKKPIRLHTGKIAIIGSGPCGLSAAYFLTNMGHSVTVFEAMPAPGGMLRYGIPKYRLPQKILTTQLKYFRNMGIEFKVGINVGKDISVEELKESGFKSFLLATGAWKNNKLNIPGENLNGVIYGLDLLREINSGHKVKLGKNVVVIGGGNVAFDAARSALRLGAQKVTVIYRRSRKEIPAFAEEVQSAEKEGVEIIFLTAPIHIREKSGVIKDLQCIKTELGNPDIDGRRKSIVIEGTEFNVCSDQIIVAVGETPDISLLRKYNLITSFDSTTMIEPGSISLGDSGILAGGDAVSGPSSVVAAIASGRKAALGIDYYLKGNNIKSFEQVQPKIVQNPPKEGIDKKERQKAVVIHSHMPPVDFTELKATFTERKAIKEVARCMTCGSKAYIAYPEDCMTCYTCELKCPSEALFVHPFKEVLPVPIKY